jgi:flagellar biosynthetic protein FliP
MVSLLRRAVAALALTTLLVVGLSAAAGHAGAQPITAQTVTTQTITTPSVPSVPTPAAGGSSTDQVDTGGIDGLDPIPELGDPTPNLPQASGSGAQAATGSGGPSISIDLGGSGGGKAPSQSILVILGIAVLSIAPSLLIMTTSFTRIVIVLSLPRNALGLQGVPPNQVLAGLALFLSLFVMGPTLSAMNHDGLQPYLRGDLNQSQAFDAATKPLKRFMLANTRDKELKLMAEARHEAAPADIQDVSLTALIPAFILSELKTAFIIGFVIFVPFVVIDLVVSSVLMSLGMMMLPPVTVSLPFKILLFVMVGGWSLVVQTLLAAYH